MVEVTDETACACTAEGQRVTPKVPLEHDDAEGHHADPYEGQGRLSSSETGVEERDTGYHNQHHARGHDDERLVTGLVPLVQVFDGCTSLRSVSSLSPMDFYFIFLFFWCWEAVRAKGQLTRIAARLVVGTIEGGRGPNPGIRHGGPRGAGPMSKYDFFLFRGYRNEEPEYVLSRKKRM